MNQHTEPAKFAGQQMPQSAGQQIAAKFEAVTKEYRLDKVAVRALCGISCAIAQGTTTFVTGPSGSGKSTLLNILGLVDQPSSGTVELFGTDVTRLSDAQAADFRAQNIGFIFQSFNLIPVLSLRENVEFPLLQRPMTPRARREQASAYLDAVGLGTMMNRRPGEISGGQRQRVAIARALVSEPRLIVADEPTANLDSRTAREIVALLQKMQAEFATTIVVCTHETHLISAQAPVIEIIDGLLA